MTNMVVRLPVDLKTEFERAAKATGKSLSSWARDSMVATAGSDLTAKSLAVEKQVPFNPAGPEVVAVAVKVRKAKKNSVPPAVIQVEAATVARKVVEQVPVVAPSAPLKYTGESSTFNGVTMYEHETSEGRRRWTKEPPKGK